MYALSYSSIYSHTNATSVGFTIKISTSFFVLPAHFAGSQFANRNSASIPLVRSPRASVHGLARVLRDPALPPNNTSKFIWGARTTKAGINQEPQSPSAKRRPKEKEKETRSTKRKGKKTRLKASQVNYSVVPRAKHPWSI